MPNSVAYCARMATLVSICVPTAMQAASTQVVLAVDQPKYSGHIDEAGHDFAPGDDPHALQSLVGAGEPDRRGEQADALDQDHVCPIALRCSKGRLTNRRMVMPAASSRRIAMMLLTSARRRRSVGRDFPCQERFETQIHHDEEIRDV